MMKKYALRRTRLMQTMQALGGGLAIIPTAPKVFRNGDTQYPYRHDSYFYYLSGFPEPEAVLVLIAPPASSALPAQSILFCRDKNPERETWDGFSYGPDTACVTFGFDAAFSIHQLDNKIPVLLTNMPTVFYDANPHYDSLLEQWWQTAYQRCVQGRLPPCIKHSIHTLIDEMRIFKDDDEILLMRRAAEISAAAHCRAMRMARPGLFEYQLEAELLYVFRLEGAQSPAYSTIVASGINACTLHYSANNALLSDGECVLIDAGCEFNSYAADISRTFPVNGRFSAAQRNLYNIVLEAQKAAINCIKPGQHVMAGHHAALQILCKGLLDLGILDKNIVGNVEEAISTKAYHPFYMHRTSHWLGMDVHDVGRYHEKSDTYEKNAKPWRILASGMVLTVEPGLYIHPAKNVPNQYWNIGIRIEDDVLVTPQGHEIFSNDVPRSIVEIEDLMASR